MTAKPVLYVAGPYTRPDPVENTHRAIQVATAIYEDGTYVPVLPHLTLLWHMVTPRPLEFWYEYDLHIMRNCDLVVRLPGPSSGADAEMVEADRVGMTVIEFDSLPDAARQEWTRG